MMRIRVGVESQPECSDLFVGACTWHHSFVFHDNCHSHLFALSHIRLLLSEKWKRDTAHLLLSSFAAGRLDTGQ